MKKLAYLLTTVLFTGCTTLDSDSWVTPMSGPDEMAVETDYTSALKCLASHARSQDYPPPRIAVGHITDLTGATDYFSGRRLTQGATLMAITAVSDAGMRLVERFDMGVIQVELDYAQNGLVRDSNKKLREISPGQIQGADLYIVGGITEFNPNIRSRSGNGFLGDNADEGGAFAFSASDSVIDVGLDLRLVDARSSEVLSVRSFRKQIFGREIEAGAFEIISGGTIDFGGGQRSLEPVQTAVRTMIDRAVFEFVAALYSLDVNQCVNPNNYTRYSREEYLRGNNSVALKQSAPASSTTEPKRHSLEDRPLPMHRDAKNLLREGRGQLQ